MKNIFKTFELCDYDKCHTIMLFQDPYPQIYDGEPVATGIALGNRVNTSISPSLKVIKDCVIDLSKPHNIVNFDVTLESWCRQGILMLNSALTCEANKIGSHVDLWRPFISSFLYKMSRRNSGLIYVLFGEQAKSFKPYIYPNNHILECKHPSYYARTGKDMPREVFEKIDVLIKNMYNEKVIWYEEN